MSFQSEAHLKEAVLSSAFLDNMTGGDPTARIAVEPKGLLGIPDIVVCLLGEDPITEREAVVFSCAFELKLRNWRRALMQAYRYRAFAHVSCVVLDADYIASALRDIERFRQANVGLLSVSESGEVTVHLSPTPAEPFSPGRKVALEARLAVR